MQTLIMPNCLTFLIPHLTKTSLWVHAKPYQHSWEGHQALKMILYNKLGVHALHKLNTNNHMDIRALAYHGEKKRHNWQA